MRFLASPEGVAERSGSFKIMIAGGNHTEIKKLAGYDQCWLDFSAVPEGSELGKQISEYTYLGNLGERYSAVMRLLPPSYRMFQPPAVLYDSMIFVSNATPTRIVPEK